MRGSVGIALFPGQGSDAEALIRRASTAAHQAKRAGSGYAFFRGDAERENTRHLALMADLHQAIDHGGLRLYVQPKVTLPGGAVCGAEALVRWPHPELGMIPPSQFVSLAETTGLINRLTYWVVDAALRQCYAWQQAGIETPLAVNLSARNLRDPRFPGRIERSFTTWGIPPERLEFELTESALMEDPEAALEVLQRFHAMGIKLFIDDFGTGYSNLGYLQKLPLDAVKIDQSFVMQMEERVESATIVHSIIDLAHHLRLKVVAEGVENRGVWERLASLGCDVAQGHYLSPPLPAEEFPAWQERWEAGRA